MSKTNPGNSRTKETSTLMFLDAYCPVVEDYSLEVWCSFHKKILFYESPKLSIMKLAMRDIKKKKSWQWETYGWQ